MTSDFSRKGGGDSGIKDFAHQLLLSSLCRTEIFVHNLSLCTLIRGKKTEDNTNTQSENIL